MTSPPLSTNTGGSASPSFRPSSTAMDTQAASAALQHWVTPSQQWTLAATKADAEASTRPQQYDNSSFTSQFSRVLSLNPMSRSQPVATTSNNTIQSPLYLVSSQPPIVNFVLHKSSPLSIASFAGDMKIYGCRQSNHSSQYGTLTGKIVSFQSTGDSLTVLATIDELVVPTSDNSSRTNTYTYASDADSNDPASLSLVSTPEPVAPKKRIRLNAFTMGCVGHQAPGLWTHPEDEAHKYTSLEYWVELAQLLERGGFDGVFLADVLGVYDVYGGNRDAALRNATQVPLIDPVLPISAMAAATKRLGFGATVSLTYELPYKFARTMSTLDHITKGRVAWNIVTSYLQSAAINLGLDTQIPHDERYNIADEFLDVCYKLWEGSWEDDAVVKDKQKRIFTHPGKVHDINHEGLYYKVPGAHLCEPSPQRTPFLFQAGASSRGSLFAAKHAEAIFIADISIPATAKHVKAIRQQINEQGRNGDGVVIYSMCTVVVGDTDEEAEQRWNEYKSYASLEGALALFGGWTGVDLSGLGPDEPLKHIETDANKSALAMFTKDPNKTWTPRMVANHIALGGRGPKVWGSVKTVCDKLEQWVDEGGIDGFNLTYVTSPHSYREFVDRIVPELRRRGRLPSQIEDSEEFDGLTLRQRMGHKTAMIDEKHPAAEYRRLRQQYSQQSR